jgi:hypothetical protein
MSILARRRRLRRSAVRFGGLTLDDVPMVRVKQAEGERKAAPSSIPPTNLFRLRALARPGPRDGDLAAARLGIAESGLR